MSNKKTTPTKWSGVPKPLSELDDDGQKMWDGLIKSIPAEMVCLADSALLTIMCKSWSTYVKYEAEFSDSVANWKLYSIMASALNNFNALAKKFGLSPLDRTKIAPTGDGKNQDDPFADIFGRLSNPKTEVN